MQLTKTSKNNEILPETRLVKTHVCYIVYCLNLGNLSNFKFFKLTLGNLY